MRDTFASFRVRNFRLYFAGQLISVSGTWMQAVAQSFLVLHLTGSGTALGLSLAARFGPMFLFALWGGSVADRLNRRRLLVVTQALAGALAATFGVLTATGAITIWMVYVLAAALGFVNVFDNPARQSFISELVPSSLLRNAVTLTSVTNNVARVLGSAVAGGAVAAFGFAVCFDLNAVSYVAVLVTLVLMKRADLVPAPRVEREKGQIREGLRYVRSERTILVPMVMIAVLGALAWEFPVSLPLLAQQTFGGDATTYGTMAACMGVGAVVGGLVSASRAVAPPRALALAAVGWGIAITLAALAPSLWSEFVVLVFVGYGSISFNSLAKTTLQLAARPQMRGRVMALWALAWQGTTPFGGPLIGWIGESFGPRWSLLAGGVPAIVVGGCAYPLVNRIAVGPADEPEPPAVVEEPAARYDPGVEA